MLRTVTLLAVEVNWVIMVMVTVPSWAKADMLPDSINPTQTVVSIVDTRWHLNNTVTYPSTLAEGLLMNVRIVNAVFEDRNRPDFDADENTNEFIAGIPEYVAQGMRTFTINLQGGYPGYEGAVNSAFNPNGSLRESYLQRVARVIEACDRHGAVVILGCYYQRQDQILEDDKAIRAGVVNVVRWLEKSGYTNVLLEIANEFGHPGFNHPILKKTEGQVELIRLAKTTWPKLLVSTSGLGDGKAVGNLAHAADFLLIHFNDTKINDFPARIQSLKKYDKPIVCNEDQKYGEMAAKAVRMSVGSGGSWGFMQDKVNQHFPFHFKGAEDDPKLYEALRQLTRSCPDGDEAASLSIEGVPEEANYFPSPESRGGWRKLDTPDEIRRITGVDPNRLSELKDWLLSSDKRNFAAVVIRNGYIVLEVERGNSAKTDSRRVASVSKAICATVLAIASEQSQQGLTPKKMTFDDPAFRYIPWAHPLSDPRKEKITVRQLFNHTSGLCPEATGARNTGTWEYILGHSGDPKTAMLAFDPGTKCGYSTHALAHASLVCEDVTGMPYDEFAVQALFKPLCIEHWWFQYFDGGEKYGRHPSHGMGMPARDLARIGYCMLYNGRWKDKQIIPSWFVEQTAAPTHEVKSLEIRFKINAETFSHGWQLPSRLKDTHSHGIPDDARYKPGSGGQLIAFVPSLDLVVTRQTGSSGSWQFEEYLRRACAVIIEKKSLLTKQF